MLAQFLQSNKLQEKINDAQFKTLLKQLTPQKKEFKIQRK
tara:strand:+ start:521 stop:640 length:120 start_codon:yes stop_codon:yes gene_type:complete